MKTLDAALILEKNQLYSSSPWIMLFEIQIDDTDYWRLAAYPENVEWNSLTWVRFPAITESITESADGSLGGLTVHVSNVDRLVSAYVENNDLLGRSVTIYVINAGHLDVTTDVLSFTYRINRIQVNEQSAAFELGHEDLFRLQLPWQRAIRDKCRWGFRDARCGYPSDPFNACTQQVFADSDVNFYRNGNFGGGWTAANMEYCDHCDINVTNDGYLTVDPTSDTGLIWNDATAAGPYLYKTISGDWDFNMRQSASTIGAAIIVQSTTDATDWIMLNHLAANAQVRVTTNGTSTETTTYDQASQWRVARVGSAFSFYYWYNSTWTLYKTVSFPTMPKTVRVGPGLSVESGTANTVLWEYFTVDSGGLQTCDYTLDGPNGCRVHQNTNNYGGFPGIPGGRLVGL